MFTRERAHTHVTMRSKSSGARIHTHVSADTRFSQEEENRSDQGVSRVPARVHAPVSVRARHVGAGADEAGWFSPPHLQFQYRAPSRSISAPLPPVSALLSLLFLRGSAAGGWRLAARRRAPCSDSAAGSPLRTSPLPGDLLPD